MSEIDNTLDLFGENEDFVVTDKNEELVTEIENLIIKNKLNIKIFILFY